LPAAFDKGTARLRSTLTAGFAALALLSSTAHDARATNVAILADGPGPRNAEILRLFQEEIRLLLAEEFDVTFANGGLVEADWTIAGVNAALDAALADPEIDVVIGLGLLTSHELCTRGPLSKPSVAPFVVDPEAQGVPFVEGRSGVKNLSYVTAIAQLRNDFESFLEVVRFVKLALVVSQTSADAIPELGARARRIAAEFGVEVTVVPTVLSGRALLEALPADTEAVYLAPLVRMPEAEFDVIVAGLIERKLPSFSYFGRSEVERGILAGNATDTEFERLARRTAINVQRMLLGEDGGTIP
jgi:hypothetical protein